MKRETLLWTVVIAIGVILLGIRFALTGGYGLAYVRTTDRSFTEITRPVVDPDTGAEVGVETTWVPTTIVADSGGVPTGKPPIAWTNENVVQVRDYLLAERDAPGQTEIKLSMSRTIGLWFAAFLTLGLFSFLYRDNPLYKLSEAIFIGVSAAYWMVVQFWSVIVPNLFGKLWPTGVKSWAMPGLAAEDPEWIYLVPLALAVMLLWRLSPKGGWIARWPLALFIGVFAGLRMISFIEGDFLNQISNSITSLIVRVPSMVNGVPQLDAAGNPIMETSIGQSLGAIVTILGVLACLTYFFFSFEHKGVVGKVSRVGIWVLMITFGAMFGFTVMGRITLLTGRLEFLFIDWLWLIDPAGGREITTILLPLAGG